MNGLRYTIIGSLLLVLIVLAVGLAVERNRTTTQNNSNNSNNNSDQNNSVSPLKTDKIEVDTPLPNSVVTSPLIVSGRAKGLWYFEGVFPVKLVNQSGAIIAQGQAKAQGEWMTDNFVPFVATLTFTAPTADSGKLILEKDNPSGLPQNADQVSLPIKFR